MNTKLYLLLLTLTTCISIHSMETPTTKILMPEGLAFPVQDIWLNVIARSCCKGKLRNTCRYFYHFASIANDKIFLQNPLIIKPELLKQYAIYFADSENNTAIISNLLDQGLDPNTEDECAYVRHSQHHIHTTKSLLYYAIENENITTINLLLNHPLLITEKVVSPFKFALELNLIEIAKNLITKKTVNILGQTYCYKATNHDIDVLKHILSLKENDSDMPHFLFKCLLHATCNNYVKLAAFILDYAVSINCALLKHGRVTITTDYPSMHRLLLKHGAQCDTIVNKQKLQSAIQFGSINTVLFLINQGVSLATGPGTAELLHLVISDYMTEQRNRIPLLQMLLNKGMDVNEKGGINNNTPLGVAVNHCHAEAVQLLLTHPDIDVNTTNDYGKTPLDIAMEKHASEKHVIYLVGKPKIDACNTIIQLLIEHGGKTSAQLAQATGDK